MIVNNTQVVDQSEAINLIPQKPGLIGALGLFRDETVATDAVTFDVRDNSFSVLADHLRNVDRKNVVGAPAYDMHTLAIPHYPAIGTIGREKLAGVRAFGKEAEAIVAAAVADELQRQVENHDVTLESIKARTLLTGVVATQNFGTINMATEFGVTRQTVALDAATADSDVIAKLRGATRIAKAGLKTGGQVSGYILFASVELYEGILSNPTVKDAFKYFGADQNVLRNELGSVSAGYSMFRLGNIDVVLYDDEFTAIDGSTLTLIPAGEGVLVPRANLGRVFFGPSSTLSGLGKFGQKRFATSFRDPKDRYVEVESEQSTLAVMEQFAAGVKITA